MTKQGETLASQALTPTLPASDPGGAADDGLPAIDERRYQLAGEIGRGGIGRVLRARDTVLHRTIAIKELHASDDATRKRFVREALITARLQHPSIVPVYEAGRIDGAPFYAMKLVAGKTLGDAITAARTLDARLALVPSVLAIADAIAYAHGERIVHRDLKPQNVLLGEFGETVVIDWGLAKDLADASAEPVADGRARDANIDHTVAGAVLGTPAYMSPEQAEGKTVDERTDVYAIGAMLYHVIAGSIPHEGDSVEAMLDTILRGDIVPITTRSPDAPADLATIIAKAMARDPSARYPTARELADDLRRFQTGQLVGAHRYTLGQRVGRWIRRRRAVVAISAVAVSVLVAYGAWSVRRIVVEHDDAERSREAALGQARIAAEHNNRAVLAQARSALNRDPAEALAWLARFDPSGPGWQSARAYALGAMARPRPDRVLPALSRDADLWVDEAGIVVVTSERAVWVANLETQATATYAITPLTSPIVCDDHVHVVGFGRIAGADVHYTIDTGAFDMQIEPISRRASIERRAACSAGFRFFIDDGAVWVWDAGKPRRLGPAPSTGHGLRNTADGRHAIHADAMGKITRYNVDAPPDVREMPLGPFDRLGWSADGRVIAFAAGDTTEVLDMATGARKTLQLPAIKVCVSPDGTWLALTDDHAITIAGVDGKVRRSIPGTGKLAHLQLSPDGRWLAGAANETVVWNVDAPVPLHLDGHTITVIGAFAGKDQLVTMDVVGRVRRWPLVAPAQILAGPVRAAARTPDGHYRITATPTKLTRSHDGAIESADLPGTGLEPVRVAVDRDGNALFAAPDGVWKWPVGSMVSHVGMHDDSTVIPEGLHPAWSKGRPVTWNGETLVVWEPRGPRRIDAPKRDGMATGADVGTLRLAVSPDGRFAAAGMVAGFGNARETVLFDLEAGRAFELPDSRCELAAFSPDGSWLVTGNLEGKVSVWDVARRSEREIGHGEHRATVAAVSPDGTRVAVAGIGDIVVATLDGRPSRSLKSPYDEPIRLITWSTRGDTLAVATETEIRFYDIDAEVDWTLPISAVSIDAIADTIVVTTARQERVFADAIPRDASAVHAWLAAIPYRLDSHDRVTTEPDRP